MSPKLQFRFIEFAMVDWNNGFFVEFRIPFSLDNLDTVLGFRSSRDIKLVK